MLDRLAEALEELQLSPVGAELDRAFALLNRFAAKVSSAVGSFDEAGGWAEEGCVDLAAWLRVHRTVPRQVAFGEAKVARRLHRLPVTRAAWEDGSLSGGQVRAVVANVSARTEGAFADDEGTLVPLLAGLGVAETAEVMQRWRSVVEDDRPEPAERRRTAQLSETLDGRYELSASLDPEGGSLLATALRLCTTEDVEGEPARTPGERRGDALIDLAPPASPHTSALRRRPPRPRTRPDGSTSRTCRPGRDGSAAPCHGVGVVVARTLRRGGGASLHRLLRSSSLPIDVGRAARTLPAATWSALVARDVHCRFPGCDRPASWCDGHHVWFWRHGGPTDLDNLVLLCGRHHTLLHTPGWHLKLLPDAAVEATTPEGRLLVSRPPPDRHTVGR